MPTRKLISIVKETGEIIGFLENGRPSTIQRGFTKLNSGDILEVVSNTDSHSYRFIASDALSSSCTGCLFSYSEFSKYKGYGIKYSEKRNICDEICVRLNLSDNIIFTAESSELPMLENDVNREDLILMPSVGEYRVRKVLCNSDTCPYYKGDLSCQSLENTGCLYIRILKK